MKDLRLLFGAMAAHFLSRILPAYGTFLVSPIAGTGVALLFGGLAIWFLYQVRTVVQSQTQLAQTETLKPQGKKGKQAAMPK